MVFWSVSTPSRSDEVKIWFVKVKICQNFVFFGIRGQIWFFRSLFWSLKLKNLELRSISTLSGQIRSKFVKFVFFGGVSRSNFGF